MQGRCGDGSHAPVGLGQKLLALVLSGNLGHDLLAVDVGGLDSLRVEGRSLLVLLFNALDFLFLDMDWRHFHSEDDVFDLALRKTGHIDVVLL